jgi:hypothetical protein
MEPQINPARLSRNQMLLKQQVTEAQREKLVKKQEGDGLFTKAVRDLCSCIKWRHLIALSVFICVNLWFHEFFG